MAFTILSAAKDRYITTDMKPVSASKSHKGYQLMPIFGKYEDAVEFKLNFLTEPEFADFRVYEVSVNMNVL